MDPAEHFTVGQIFVRPDILTQLRGDVGDSVVHASQVNFLVTGHTSHVGLSRVTVTSRNASCVGIAFKTGSLI